MNPNPVDNNGNGEIDNLTLTAAQITNLRASAMVVPGLEIDPPMVVYPGDFVADRIMDRGEKEGSEAYLDLTSVRLAFDKKVNRVFVESQLRGTHPEKGGTPSTHWMVLDTTEASGAPAEKLEEIGFRSKKLAGADLVLRVDVRYPDAKVTAWKWDGVKFSQHPRAFAEVQTLVMHPYLIHAPGIKTPEISDARIYDKIVASFPAKLAGIGLGKPVKIDVSIDNGDGKEFDQFTPVRPDSEFVFEDPDFPHCYVQDQGEPGGKVPVLVEGLLPKQPIHALVGPTEVAKADTDSSGKAQFDLPIPEDATTGRHLVTIGVDNTALTADCVVQVGKDERDGRNLPHKGATKEELIRSHLGVMKESLDAIRELR